MSNTFDRIGWATVEDGRGSIIVSGALSCPYCGRSTERKAVVPEVYRDQLHLDLKRLGMEMEHEYAQHRAKWCEAVDEPG